MSIHKLMVTSTIPWTMESFQITDEIGPSQSLVTGVSEVIGFVRHLNQPKSVVFVQDLESMSGSLSQNQVSVEL